MALAYFRMLISEFLKNDQNIVPEEAPIIILDGNYAVFMDKNRKNTNHTQHIYRGVNFVRNGERFKMHRIDWCEEGLQLAYIATKNVGENDLNPRIKYIMLRLNN